MSPSLRFTFGYTIGSWGLFIGLLLWLAYFLLKRRNLSNRAFMVWYGVVVAVVLFGWAVGVSAMARSIGFRGAPVIFEPPIVDDTLVLDSEYYRRENDFSVRVRRVSSVISKLGGERATFSIQSSSNLGNELTDEVPLAIGEKHEIRIQKRIFVLELLSVDPIGKVRIHFYDKDQRREQTEASDAKGAAQKPAQ